MNGGGEGPGDRAGGEGDPGAPPRRGRGTGNGMLFGGGASQRGRRRAPAWLGTVEVIVCYDVATDSRAGRRRLRRVANVCLGFGQRVQQSVFECRVTEAQLEELEFKLLSEIDQTADRLRIYRLAGDRDRLVRTWGAEPPNDFREPLIV